MAEQTPQKVHFHSRESILKKAPNHQTTSIETAGSRLGQLQEGNADLSLCFLFLWGIMLLGLIFILSLEYICMPCDLELHQKKKKIQSVKEM